MSIYKRDDVFPEWEPIPWDMGGDAADEQERGFHSRALQIIEWRPVPFDSFPTGGIFGHQRDWFSEHEIDFYASHDGEDLVLIRNGWNGFPDPPEWGLASRPAGRKDMKWEMRGHVPNLPETWSRLGSSAVSGRVE